MLVGEGTFVTFQAVLGLVKTVQGVASVIQYHMYVLVSLAGEEMDVSMLTVQEILIVMNEEHVTLHMTLLSVLIVYLVGWELPVQTPV